MIDAPSKSIETAFNSQNHLLKCAKRGSKIPDLATVALVSLGFMLLGSFFAGTFLANHVGQVLYRMMPAIASSPLFFSVYQTIWLCCASLPIYFLVWRWLKWYERRQFWTLGFERRGWIVKILLGSAIGVLVAAGTILLLVGLQVVRLEPSKLITEPSQSALGLCIPLIGLMFQATAQEVVFRGWLLPVIGSRYNWKVGVVLSALLSAVFNIFTLNNPLELLNVALLGVFLAFYAMHEGSIWGVCAFQTFWLWANSNLFGFPRQSQFALNSIAVNVIPTRLEWLSGDELGLRSSAILTIVLVSLSAGLFAFNYYYIGQSAVPDSLASAAKLRLRNSRRNARRSRRS